MANQATRPATVREGAEPVRVIEYAPVPVYKVEDLVGKAREAALEWLAEVNTDQGCLDGWRDMVVEDLRACGIDVAVREGKTAAGRLYKEPKVYYSFGYCQGDGMDFEGRMDLERVLMAHDPNNRDGFIGRTHKDLPTLAKGTLESLADLLAKDPDATLDIAHRGHYHHYNSMELTLTADALPQDYATGPLEKDLAAWVSSLSRYFEEAGYSELEDLRGEESCLALAEANDYTFDADGDREG